MVRLLNLGMFFIEQQTFVRSSLLMKRLAVTFKIQKMKVVRNAPERPGAQMKTLRFGTYSKSASI